jgi:hypothetical protein
MQLWRSKEEVADFGLWIELTARRYSWCVGILHNMLLKLGGMSLSNSSSDLSVEESG